MNFTNYFINKKCICGQCHWNCTACLFMEQLLEYKMTTTFLRVKALLLQPEMVRTCMYPI